MSHAEVLIVGGGTAGLTFAAHLARQPAAPKITVIEPRDTHYYQPLWTLVGGGVFPREDSVRSQADVIPAGVEWIQDSVTEFEPEKSLVKLASGKSIEYQQLVVAPGIQLNWDDVKGLKAALGQNGVCSNYSYDTVEYTWDAIRATRSGNAIFTFPATPIKCAGAPQKIMYLAEETFRKRGVRKHVNVLYGSATAGIFGVPKYKVALEKIVASRDIQTAYQHNLVEIRSGSKEAVFRDMENDSEVVKKFEMIHVTPPQSAPDFVRQSPLANEAGWVDVHKHTLQHNKFDNVFSLGDASSLPCSKTGAAVRKQAPVLAKNIMAYRGGTKLAASYDGYASCPLVTGYGKVMLAEFGYDGAIMETFPFDQAKERFSMYTLKAYGLPQLYWNGMLRGLA